MKKTFYKTLLFVAFFAAWGCLSSAHALVAIEKTFDQLVSEADLILVGTVADLQGKRMNNGAIATHITFDDINIVKGQTAHQTYTLEMLGGTIGREHFEIPGAPTFTLGETYVLFIKGNRTSMFPLVGATQGQFIVRHEHSGELAVLIDTHNRVITGIGSDHAILTEASHSLGSQSSPYTLTMFLDDIKKRLRP